MDVICICYLSQDSHYSMFCVLGEVGAKLYVVVLGPFALDSSCATLLAQINVAHRKLCNNLVFPFS